LSLAKQIPTLVQHYLDLAKPVAIGFGRGTMGFPIEEFVLLAGKLINVFSDFLVIHNLFLISVRAWAPPFSRPPRDAELAKDSRARNNPQSFNEMH
jgi:hypothetical protein